jgi:hypothetical protein
MKAMDLPGYAFRSVIWSQWAYWCSLAMAVVAVQVFPPGFTRNAIACLPLLTAALCVSVAFWVYESCDEFVRFAILRGVVWTAIVVAAATCGWFIAELAGAPRLSAIWVNLFGWSVFNLQFTVTMLRSR